ncbi:Rieske (2Fe-2S) protein [uncultured Desulfuromusa sp.]|uniref:Rieske (2Fe-2S) protein n=1 Tax=uncultured Desulfuromusa sp. TaxID=219183 RepID=UPI002AA7E456|nr:Rieske (2Fe-2S) protein [uncultured Desulfuromusa sp.]
MSKRRVKRSFFQRILGSPATQEPAAANCWNYENGQLFIDLQRAPELQISGGALRLEGGSLPLRILVVNSEDGEYRAYHNRCTHIGHRRLDPVPGTNTVQCCSLNHSTFGCHGETIDGPARRSIQSFPVEKDQEKLIISIASFSGK